MRLDVESQGEFVSLINAIQMQLDSMVPVERVVHLLSDAVIALAEDRGLDPQRLRLRERLDDILKCVAGINHTEGGR